ncbi:DMT family transporter [Fodinicurvata sediminis]|uniref:DMT family transporter n=1 Tax=Fodinicurvata sediminis TaxID=1121832 RepID=UPI0003B6D61D|nr:DMT family transporter [Fodinicurvata sediminis]
MAPNIQSQGSMTPGTWGLLVTLSLLWGGAFFFVGVAVKSLPPLTIVALRLGLAASALWCVCLLRGVTLPRSPAIWRAFLVMGVFNNAIPFSLIVWGQSQIASGLASILNATTPLFTVVLAGIFLADERVTGLKLSGVFVGLVGTVVMIGPAVLTGREASALAQLAILGAALSYASAAVFGRRFRDLGVHPLMTATGQVTMSSLILVPLALLVDRPFTLDLPPAEVWLAILALALLSTALAYILYFRILSLAGATSVQLVTFLVPVTAILLGALVLGERLAPQHFAGMGLIALGLAVIDGRLPRHILALWRSRIVGKTF